MTAIPTAAPRTGTATASAAAAAAVVAPSPRLEASALFLGVAAALGILYAAWQTLRADDELWVADDPLRAPDA